LKRPPSRDLLLWNLLQRNLLLRNLLLQVKSQAPVDFGSPDRVLEDV
jgi:hypothetical protein